MKRKSRNRRKAMTAKAEIRDFHIYLSASLAEMVQDVADGNGRSISKQVTVWIEREITRISKGLD